MEVKIFSKTRAYFYPMAWISAVSLIIGSFSEPCLAQEGGQVLRRVAVPIEMSSHEEHVLCVISREGRLNVSNALLSPLRVEQSANGSEQGLVGCLLPTTTDARGTLSLVATDALGTTTVHAINTENFLESESELETEDLVSESLKKRRELLASFQLQLKTQEQSLGRLRNDADLVANQSGLSALEAEYQAMNGDLEMVEGEIESLNSSVKQIKELPTIINAGAREIELTKQLSELALVAKTAENAQQQSNNSDTSLTYSMQLIEATRFDNPDQLRDELISTRRRRQELEETFQVRERNPVDYE